MKKENFTRQYSSLKNHAEYVNIIQLEKLNKKQKELLLNELYNGDLKIEIDIFTSNKNYTGVDITFMDYNKPDLCVNHFGYNFYFRTNKAIKCEKYKTLGQAIGALKRLFKKHNINQTSNLRFYKNGYNVFNLQFDV